MPQPFLGDSYLPAQYRFKAVLKEVTLTAMGPVLAEGSAAAAIRDPPGIIHHDQSKGLSSG
jgi:hypothetical protein